MVSRAQSDTLPQFSLTERNGIVFISWNNPFPDVKQLIIQRSTDSTKFFRSVMSMPDPTSSSNGYVDKTEGAYLMYYRIFYVLPGGKYEFTQSKKPVHIEEMIKPEVKNKSNLQKTRVKSKIKPTLKPTPKPTLNPTLKPTYSHWDSIKRLNLIQRMGERTEKHDTKPKLQLLAILSKPNFESSAFIFSNEEGNLILLLPEAERKHYELKIFKDDGSPVFKMKNIKERYLLVDRSNFYQSGWFRYELYESGRIKGKNRFFIPPDSQ